jgi:hypothetical protein
MSTRRLVFGLGVLVIIAGLLLAALSPGGWFNQGQTREASIKIPIWSWEIKASEEKSSAWPIVGYVLLGVGGVALVVGFAMTAPPRSPHAGGGSA